MARNIENVLTVSGVQLLTNVTGHESRIRFTKAELGRGTAGDSADITQRTNLIDKAFDAAISKKTVKPNGQMVITVQFTNTSVLAATYIGEIGVYAMEEGVAGSEVLFSYMTFGDTKDLILPYSSALVQRVYDIPYVFNGASNVSITISPAAIVTQEEVLARGAAEDDHGNSNEGKLVGLNAEGKLDVDITGNAITLGGHSAAYFATSDHDHTDATISNHGYMSTTDKTRHDTMSGWMNQDVRSSATPTFKGININGGYIDGAKFR